MSWFGSSPHDLFTGLLGDLDPVSAKHLVPITLGKIRLGIGTIAESGEVLTNTLTTIPIATSAATPLPGS